MTRAAFCFYIMRFLSWEETQRTKLFSTKNGNEKQLKWEKLDEMTFLIKNMKIKRQKAFCKLLSTPTRQWSFSSTSLAAADLKKLSIKFIKQWRALKLFMRFYTLQKLIIQLYLMSGKQQSGREPKTRLKGIKNII